jgi:hypothetical protein
LKAKIIAFPSAEFTPKPSPSLQVLKAPTDEPASSPFRGGGLRGLFWAAVIEGVLFAAAAGIVMTWHLLTH